MEVCVCGNVIDATKTIRIRHVFCRCEKPGPGSRAGKVDTLDDDLVTKQQYEERKRAGLPVLTPLEKSLNDRWI